MAEITLTNTTANQSWEPFPKISFCDEDRTVTVTHRPYPIREYAEVRAGKVCALLGLLAVANKDRADVSYEIAFGLAQQLADEVSVLVEVLTREDLPGVSDA